MRRTWLGVLVGLAVCAALPAAASARPVLAVGDQKPSMFSDPRFRWLGVRHSRIVVSWRVEQTPWEQRLVDEWLRAARVGGVTPLVAFGHAWGGRYRRTLPSVKAYAHAVRAFRRQYPWVREYTAWNEANHCSQPTCKHPARAAAYYNELRRQCPRCTIVAADVLDQKNMASWLRTFRRHAHGRPRLWGLHNYLDANRLRSSGTRDMLGAVKGTVWMTETGGIVRRTHYKKQIGFEESADHAALATDWIIRLANRYRRIGRVYLYQWSAISLTQVWDSGLIGPFGESRPAFGVLARAMSRDPAQAPGDQPTSPSAPPPNEQPPPSDSSEPPPSNGGDGGSSGGGSPPPPPGPAPLPVPPPPSCGLPICTLG